MFELESKFMVRTPSLPHQCLDDFFNQEKDIISFIKENDKLNSYFRKALLISSPSLYKSFIDIPSKKKKRNSLEQSLYKYFIRATTRPTPYGYLSGVSLCSTSQSNMEIKIVKDNTKKNLDIKVDNNWINKLIQKLESDVSILRKLKIIKNPIVFESGDRYKNPVYSQGGTSNIEKMQIEELDIRNSHLVSKVFNLTTDFVSFKDIMDVLRVDYKNVPDQIIENFLQSLIENEFLYTSLRIPAYCSNSLNHLEAALTSIEEADSIVKSIVSINKDLEKFKESESESLLQKIYEKMKSLSANDSYVILNKGDILNTQSLDSRIIKKHLNPFIRTINHICVEEPKDINLTEFKRAYIDRYGENVEVPLSEIIDSNKFDGLRFLDKPRQISESKREQLIRKIIANKITIATKNDTDVHLAMNDFSNVPSIDEACLPEGFDLNTFITIDKNNGYCFSLGPGVGTIEKGAMYERFIDCFPEKEIFNENLNSLDYIPVEIHERGKGRINNVINPKKISKYYFPIACYGNEDHKIEFSDIVLGIDLSQNLYLKSISLGQKIKMIQNNMMNSKIGSKLYQLLYHISKTYTQNIFQRLGDMMPDKIYNPRVFVEGVQVKGKTWFITDNMLPIDNFEAFQTAFEKLKKELTINDHVYTCRYDNRLLVNLTNTYDLKLLFGDIKKNGVLQLNELEKNLFNGSVIRDTSGNSYVSEFVFSFSNKNNLKMNKTTSEALKINSLIQEKNRTIMPFEDGWLYLKIYGLGNRTDELLSKELDSLLNNLTFDRYFFIRFGDSEGNHIRLRIKFGNQGEAIKSIPLLCEWIKVEKEKNLFNRIEFDTYLREHNRYGGYLFSDLYEQVFYLDSQFAKEITKMENKEEKDKIEFIGVVSIFKIVFTSEVKALKTLDRYIDREAFKKEYRKNKDQYLELVEKSWEKEDIISKDLLNIFSKRNSVINEYFSFLKKYQNETGPLSSSIEDIAFSVIHMFCNRLNGNRSFEQKTISIIRHCLFDLESKKAYSVTSS